MLQAMRNPVVQRALWITVIGTFVVVFIFAETSGLLGRSPVTPGTAVGSVNGQDISIQTWQQVREQRIKQAQDARGGQPLSLDETRRIEDQAWDQLVNDMLLDQEIQRRHLDATDAEVVDASMQYIPPEFQQSPEFQTAGRFDPDKYLRYLRSPMAKQQGVRVYLENYYRTQIPRQKLYEQVSASVYIPDSELWWRYQLTHDSAQVSYVQWRTDSIPDSAVQVSDAEVQKWFDAHASKLDNRPGRAVLTVTEISRVPTAADSAAARAHAVALRDSITSGKLKFEDAAKAESADSASAVKGGELGKSTKGQYVPDFEKAAYALTPGQLSDPVATPFGFHLIRVNSKKGDTLDVSHILLKVQQSDSAASRSDKLADELTKLGGNAEQGAKFDTAVKSLGLPVMHGVAIEGEPLQIGNRMIPSVSAWAFGGTAKPGETSDLFEDENGYYLARLDSLTPGGKPDLKAMTPEIRHQLAEEKKVDLLVPKAQQVSNAVRGGQTLEAAAAAAGMKVNTTPMFTRVTPVAGLGQANEAIGAAFALPVGAVSAPVKTDRAVDVLRVDKRVNADRAAFEKEKATERENYLQGLRQQRVRDFLAGLRETAKIVDNRKTVEARMRGTGA